MKSKKYIYPVLPAVKDLYSFRIGGSGLANCLFVYAKAIVKAEDSKQKIITPTWFNFSIGTYLRRQKDKRHYINIFTPEISGLKKLLILFFYTKRIDIIEGITEYFEPLKGNSTLVRKYLLNQLSTALKKELPQIVDNVISLHIRLGDYPEERRVPMRWYIEVVNEIKEASKGNFVFHVFSDGNDEALKEIISIEGVERKSYNNAFLDMWALSKSKIIIASDSTFSAWGAYLNQVPVIFYKRHFPSVLDNKKNEIVIGDEIEQLLPWFNQVFKK